MLTDKEAFAAMWLFVRRFVDQAGNDLATFLGDTELQTDGMPFDPAAWSDWSACVRDVKNDAWRSPSIDVSSPE